MIELVRERTREREDERERGQDGEGARDGERGRDWWGRAKGASVKNKP